MLIHQDFQQLPPKMFMMQIMDNTSKLYCFLWDKKDEKNKVTFTWKDLSQYYNKNTFKTSLRKLNNEGLLSYREYFDKILIELVGWNEM